MKIETKKLLRDLESLTRGHITVVETFEQISMDILNQRASQNSWSALECLEHLNRYGDFYIPAMSNAIASCKNKEPQLIFKSGLLGNYFAKSMLPKEKLNKMKSFKNMNPIGASLGREVVTTFLTQQSDLLSILKNVATINMNKTKTPTSISNLVKLRIGDTLRVVIYHNERHILQAQKATEVVNS